MTSQSSAAAYVYDDAMSGHLLRADHPMRPVRLRYTYQLLEAYGAFNSESSLLVEPWSATVEELLTTHTLEYVQAVERYRRRSSRPRCRRVWLFGAGRQPGLSRHVSGRPYIDRSLSPGGGVGGPMARSVWPSTQRVGYTTRPPPAPPASASSTTLPWLSTPCAGEGCALSTWT